VTETETPQNLQEVPKRVEALREAARLINSDRDAQYGPPTANFARIATLLNVIWEKKLVKPINAEDVAMMMVCVKVGRYAADSGFQPDTWIDIAGYAGCGYEVGAPE
jgi:hypothetical protein